MTSITRGKWAIAGLGIAESLPAPLHDPESPEIQIPEAVEGIKGEIAYIVDHLLHGRTLILGKGDPSNAYVRVYEHTITYHYPGIPNLPYGGFFEVEVRYRLEPTGSNPLPDGSGPKSAESLLSLLNYYMEGIPPNSFYLLSLHPDPSKSLTRNLDHYIATFQTPRLSMRTKPLR